MFDKIFEIVWLILFILAIVIRVVGVSKSGYRRDKDSKISGIERFFMFLSFLGMQLLPFLYVLTPWLDFADYHLPTYAGWVGAAVFAFGLFLLYKSHTGLGSNFSPQLEIRKEHTLVKEGVFHYIRHPMYASHLLWAIAQVLLLQNWIVGPFFLISFILVYIQRVPREEQMMLEHYGEEYRNYMSQTGRIIPRFWK